MANPNTQNQRGAGNSTNTPAPLTTEEEDHIILARITNDERPLRRVLKKFHHYTSSTTNGTVAREVDDARESFLVELASYQLTLKKSMMICEAEGRQVGEYQRERHRIDEEHDKLRAQLEQLKVALDLAQMERKRKIEYDNVAEKVNTLPSRDELERSIQDLESEMHDIRTEHDLQTNRFQDQKARLDNIIADIVSLRSLDHDGDCTSNVVSVAPTPNALDDGINDGTDTAPEGMEQMNIDGPSSKEEGESDTSHELVGNDGHASTAGDDIEMGEVQEDPEEKHSKNAAEEELEEGEASDASSELSEPPDD